MDSLARGLTVDEATDADLPRIYEIFEQRPGAWTPKWQVFPGSAIVVVRDRAAGEIAAFAILRQDLERREFTVDALECERGEERATVRGICALRVFGEWLESYVRANGGGEIFSCVGADNRTHEQALRKVGYEDRVHILSKRIEGVI